MTRASEVPRVPLADGVLMPLVGFGTWQLRGRQAYEAIRHALDVGYRHLDTATMYGNETEVGRAVRDSGLSREEVFITTKLPPSRAGRERETLTASLHALGTEYVDLWLIHWPPSGRAGPPVWREFLALRDDGMTRTVGVSNYSLRELDELHGLSGESPVVNQVPWRPAQHDPRILAGHRDRGVVLEGYSPIKGTNLRDARLTAIADRHGVSTAQVVLRWHLEHGIAVIPKSARPERIRSNLDLFDFRLDPAETSQIDTL
jgi:diketogulonate reductase-like aldo/keto reductase